MSKTQAPAAAGRPQDPPKESAHDPKDFPGFAGHVISFKHESAFLRSFYSRPTSVMDEHGNSSYPYGDNRVIMPTSRDIRQLGLPAHTPKEEFPAVSLQDGAGNWAQDYLRNLIVKARGTRFSNYEIRLALRRIGGEGVKFGRGYVRDAFGDAQDAATALKNLIDKLWATEDSLCRALTLPIPQPESVAEV